MALRAIAARVESGETQISRELAAALASELEAHPELADELDAFEAIDDATPEWHLRELERCDRDDSGGEPWDVVRARILARSQRNA